MITGKSSSFLWLKYNLEKQTRVKFILTNNVSISPITIIRRDLKLYRHKICGISPYSNCINFLQIHFLTIVSSRSNNKQNIITSPQIRCWMHFLRRPRVDKYRWIFIFAQGTSLIKEELVEIHDFAQEYDVQLLMTDWFIRRNGWKSWSYYNVMLGFQTNS